jgi:predicted Zn-dependent protease
MKHALVTALLGLLAAGCATASLPPVTAANFAPEEDERRMWAQAEEEQKKINESGAIYREPELDAYLNAVAHRLQSPAVLKAIPFAIRVLNNPVPNASAAPNGAIYIHTGLLARMGNEAQLATLLGHEMTHATHRHGVRDFRNTKNKTAFLATMNTTLGAVPFVGGLTSLAGAVGTAAAITGYSRDQERDADREGLRLMVRAGYDPREAPKLFYELKKELEDEKIEEPLFYASHPRIQGRIDTYEDLLKTEYRDRPGGVTNAGPFLKKIHKVVLHNAQLDLKAGRFPQARRGAEKAVAIKPNDPRGHYLQGEVFRQQGADGDVEKAVAAYRKALSIDTAYPDPHKGLGLVHFKRGEKPLAKKSFQAYLSLAPKASDRSYVEEYLKQCK